MPCESLTSRWEKVAKDYNEKARLGNSRRAWESLVDAAFAARCAESLRLSVLVLFLFPRGEAQPRHGGSSLRWGRKGIAFPHIRRRSLKTRQDKALPSRDLHPLRRIIHALFLFNAALL